MPIVWIIAWLQKLLGVAPGSPKDSVPRELPPPKHASELDDPLRRHYSLPAREMIPPTSIRLSRDSASVHKVWIEEIGNYIVRHAQDRAAYFTAPEVRVDDLIDAYQSLQGATTLDKIEDIVGQRLMPEGFVDGSDD